MTSIELTEGAFIITSYGHGLCYEVRDRLSKRSIFLQGDEAADFRVEYDTLSELHPSYVQSFLGDLLDTRDAANR